jgi:hypothetical protein
VAPSTQVTLAPTNASRMRSSAARRATADAVGEHEQRALVQPNFDRLLLRVRRLASLGASRWGWIATSVVPRFRRFDADPRSIDASLRRIASDVRIYTSMPGVLPHVLASESSRRPPDAES